MNDAWFRSLRAAPTLGAVLRLAGAILRRRALLLALLALTLEVAPVLLLHAMTDPVRRAISPPFATSEAYVVALTAYYAFYGADGLAQCSAFACNVAVVLVGLEGDRPPGPVFAQARGIVLRLVGLNVVVWIAAELSFRSLPGPWGSCVYAALSCWTVVVPVYAAEGTALARLAGRSLSVFAGGGRTTAAVLLSYCVGAIGLTTLSLHVADVLGRDPAAVWAGLAAISAASAAFNVAADTAVVALYRELHRRERAIPPTALVEAFE